MRKLILTFVLLIGLLSANPCWAVITVDQTGSNFSGTGATSGTVTITINANTLILVGYMIDDNGDTISVPTATGLTFVQIGTTFQSLNNFNIGIFRAYTSSSLGSTVITGHWTGAGNDWILSSVTLTGTAGTAGNNGSDAIGNNAQSTVVTASPVTVTVTSSSHNNSKYFGVAAGASTTDQAFVKGANYTNVMASVFNTNFETGLTEISTNPVSPAADTAVDATFTNTGTAGEGLMAVEILASGAAAPTGGVKAKVKKLEAMDAPRR